ncbi:MAG: response regulator transcription factor [Clostridiales bacterium]|nr:response regulator transcription factor [Clostridiales bacterium]
MSDTILIVEDEEKLARFIELELLHEGYQVKKAYDGRTGLMMAEGGEADLVLLDIMLPQLNGLEVLRRLRKASELPVILLTARDEVMDKVAGLDGGADDYITKPFAIEELLARIRVALKKSRAGKNGISRKKEEELIFGKLTMDLAAHQVFVGQQEVVLTNREFTLLEVLLKNKNIVLSRDTLMEKVCGYDYVGETNVIDVYVRYLRGKIDDPFQMHVISTVRGVGYVIRDEE